MHSESEHSRIAEWRRQEDWNRETPASHSLHSESYSSPELGPETAVPRSEAAERYRIDEEEEEDSLSPSQETPRRPSPSTHVSSPSFKRASSSLNSTFMNGD